MNIVLLESLAISQQALEQYARPLLEAGHTFTAYARDVNPEVMMQRAKDADVLMLANMPLPGQVIDACERLKFIDVAFTGVDHVDLEAARRKGVAVSNASGYSNESVAELCLCLMLSLLRNVPQVDARCRAGGTKDGLVGWELKGKTVGVVGLGAIGSRTAELCHAFGAEIVAYTPHPKADAPDYIQFMPLDDLLKTADLVTLHCPLNASSKGLINAEKIALMKPTAYLINAARGPVVDSQALADALNADRLAGAGVDVFETEPPLDPSHPLLNAKHVIVTPHVAFATAESMVLRADIVFDNLNKWLNGQQINKVL